MGVHNLDKAAKMVRFRKWGEWWRVTVNHIHHCFKELAVAKRFRICSILKAAYILDGAEENVAEQMLKRLNLDNPYLHEIYMQGYGVSVTKIWGYGSDYWFAVILNNNQELPIRFEKKQHATKFALDNISKLSKGDLNDLEYN